ncbi:hypothetical protein B0T10DRAFT_565704 [Thelonectria olida]|uniref:Ecp2 effector protein-like domain-containing protein n=1 Tax=Thelonectria olida TaxID=1576542 RepID=A0A9P8VYT5_9HYPO|nr:hypothetical protein B0T10DRAFT_565704 [Thelonectria olida]
MRSSAVPIALAALIGLVSAAPTNPPTTTAATTTSDGVIMVPTVLSCGSSTDASASTSASATPVAWIPAAHDQKACDESSFAQSTKKDPVPYADWEACAQLYSLWSAYNGTFNIGTNAVAYKDDGITYDFAERAVGQEPKVSYTPILQSDSCTFALHSAHPDKVLALGDVDVGDILKTALNEYSSGSLLGVKGSVNCAVRGEKDVKAALKWQLYYPGA